MTDTPDSPSRAWNEATQALEAPELERLGTLVPPSAWSCGSRGTWQRR
jgi:hypothetical protein